MLNIKIIFERYTILFILMGYFAISILVTLGLASDIKLKAIGDYGDTRGVIWALWAKNNGLLDNHINYLIAAPFGVPNITDISTPVSESIGFILTKLFNEIVSYNIFILLSFPLTAVGTYFLLIYLLHNKFSAFIGGLIFGFCPGAVMQVVGGHALFAFNIFIPLFLLALFYNRSKRTFFSSALLAASFSLIVLSSLYFGYFAIYICIFFFAFDFIGYKSRDRRPLLINYIVTSIITLLIIIPSQYRTIYHQFTASKDTLLNAGRIQDIGQLITYSSRPWDFLLPSVDHPIFGRYVYDFVLSNLHGSNVFEQTQFLGIIPLSLLLLGLILLIRRKMIGELRNLFLFFSFGALWMYFLSLPPLLSFGDLNVPTVSWFAYKLTPMFRVYSRFGILVNLFLACAVAVVMTYLYNNLIRKNYYIMVALIIPFILFEYLSKPSNANISLKEPTSLYNWIAGQPGDFIIAEYPMINNNEFPFYSYLFWQRIHKKRLVNGASRNNSLAWDFYNNVKNLEDPKATQLLKSVGVKYVIVHSKMYEDGPIPEPIKRYYPVDYADDKYNDGNIPVIPFHLKLVKSFGSDFVFAFKED